MTTAEDAKRTLADAPSGRRYTEPAIHLHWITPPLVLAQVVLAWVMLCRCRTNAPNAGFLFGLHKSLGLDDLAADPRAARLAVHAPRAGPRPRDAAVDGVWAGKANHWLMYLVLFGMPISGFVMSAHRPLRRQLLGRAPAQAPGQRGAARAGGDRSLGSRSGRSTPWWGCTWPRPCITWPCGGTERWSA